MKLRVATLCSGYDSQCMALDRLKQHYPDFDYDLIAWSEIDKNAIKAHNAVYPQWADRNLGDMTKIDWTQVGDIDLLTYSTPCFVAGTMVLTKNGYKPIENVKIGDSVFTKEMTIEKVIDYGNAIKSIYSIKAAGIPEIVCTRNHPFFVRHRNKKWNNDLQKYEYLFDAPCRKEYKDIDSNDYIGIPIIKEEYLPFDIEDENLWLMGRYVADGCINYRELKIAIAKKKLHQIAHITQKYWTCQTSENCYNICFGKTSRIYNLIKFFDFGIGSHNKDIPNAILNLPIDKLKIFLQGYLSGDAWLNTKDNRYSATTTSKKLALALVLAIQKCYGVGCSVYYNYRKGHSVIEGRKIKLSDYWEVRFTPTPNKPHYFNDGDFIWYNVQKKTDLHKKATVYNMTVNNSHTYLADNCAVFNCTDISSAGQQKGLAKDSGTRSSILWFTEEAIRIKRPRYLLMENVKALVQRKFLPYFHAWLDVLASYGYTNFAKVLGYSRSTKPLWEGHYQTFRHFSQLCNAIAAGRRDTNEILIVQLFSRDTSPHTNE